MDIESLRLQLEKYHQGQLLKYWDELTDDQRTELTDDIVDLNLTEVNSYFSRAIEFSKNNNKILDDQIQPINDVASAITCDPVQWKEYEDMGFFEISTGRVAVLLMAGGQGTRLGVNYPKGMYDVGLLSHKTLFQLQAERIRKLEYMAKERHEKCQGITWYILTSDTTHETTLNYFEQNNYFGLNKNNIKAFKQGMIPCFDFDGKIILDEKHRISKAPDGNGGLYRALKAQGILDDMIKRHIYSVHVHSVDNILIKVADPIFIGYCLKKKADCGAKFIKKIDPHENVGVICQVDGEYQVVEYSEISKESAELRRSNGELAFNIGNICNHYFSVDFLQYVCMQHENELKLHLAKKKIPFIDDKGVKVKPTSPNGIKIEKFVFDVFKFASNFAAWEVSRESEFSPLKNHDSTGLDCPSTARRSVFALHKIWLLKAGAKLVQDDVEISPLLSYNGENLKDIPEVIYGPRVFE